MISWKQTGSTNYRWDSSNRHALVWLRGSSLLPAWGWAVYSSGEDVCAGATTKLQAMRAAERQMCLVGR